MPNSATLYPPPGAPAALAAVPLSLPPELDEIGPARPPVALAEFYNPYHDAKGRFASKNTAVSGLGLGAIGYATSDGLYFSEREHNLSFAKAVGPLTRADVLAGAADYFNDRYAAPDRQRAIDDFMRTYDALGWEGLPNGSVTLAIQARHAEQRRIAIKKAGEAALEAAVGAAVAGPDGTFVFYTSPREWQAAWAATANDDGGAQDALHLTAIERAHNPARLSQTQPGIASARGLESEFWRENGMTETAREAAQRPSERRAAFDSIYHRTQAYFAAQGLGPEDTVVVYRGMRFRPDDPAVAQVRDLPLDSAFRMRHNALSSWSLDYATAKRFAEDPSVDDDYYASREPFGLVVAARVKVKAVFSHWSTGLGCADEDEVIVLGDALTDTPLTKVRGYNTEHDFAAAPVEAPWIDADAGDPDWLLILQRAREAAGGAKSDLTLAREQATAKLAEFFNPYHDKRGRFASGPGARATIDPDGEVVYDSPSASGLSGEVADLEWIEANVRFGGPASVALRYTLANCKLPRRLLAGIKEITTEPPEGYVTLRNGDYASRRHPLGGIAGVQVSTTAKIHIAPAYIASQATMIHEVAHHVAVSEEKGREGRGRMRDVLQYRLSSKPRNLADAGLRRYSLEDPEELYADALVVAAKGSPEQQAALRRWLDVESWDVLFAEAALFNPYHDKLGRFAAKDGAGARRAANNWHAAKIVTTPAATGPAASLRACASAEEFRQAVLNDAEIAGLEGARQQAEAALTAFDPLAVARTAFWEEAARLEQAYGAAEEAVILGMAARLAPADPVPLRAVFSNDKHYSIKDYGAEARAEYETLLTPTARALAGIASRSVVEDGGRLADRAVRIALMNIGGVSWYAAGEGDHKIHLGCLDNPQLRGTLVHEFGHWLEDRTFGAEDAAYDLSAKRSTGPVRRQAYPDGARYSRPDKWPEEYAETIYPNSAWAVEVEGRPRYTTELHSVGLEWLLTQPRQLAVQDPELFNLVVSTLSGLPAHVEARP